MKRETNQQLMTFWLNLGAGVLLVLFCFAHLTAAQAEMAREMWFGPPTTATAPEDQDAPGKPPTKLKPASRSALGRTG
ncbi:hypothetical protein DYH09_07965 [bacterium CPR1]|nr:hypothetical protein [bacterium CPR1]